MNLENGEDDGRLSTRYVLPALAISLLLLGQWRTIAYCWENWMAPNSYYSHGPVIPIFSGYAVWLNRIRLRSIDVRGSWLSLPILLFTLVMSVFGTALELEPLSSAAFILSIFGIIIGLFGVRVASTLFFPILILGMMIPLPSFALDSSTGHFQLLSTTLAAKALHLFDKSLVQHGNILASENLPGTLAVDSPCSGLKLFIALVFSTCFLAYIVKGVWWKKTLLIGLSLPLSIAINSIRIIMIAVVGMCTYSMDAVHEFHDWSGYIGLVLCVLSVLGFARVMRIGSPRDFESSRAIEEVSVNRRVGARFFKPGLVVVVLLALTAAVNMFVGRLYALPVGHLDRGSIPQSFGAWNSTDLQIGEDVKSQLRKGDLLSRMYIDGHDGSRQVHLFADAALDNSAFHTPRICLVGSGMQVRNERLVTLEFGGSKPITAHATKLDISDGGQSGQMIYWYMFGDRSFPDPAALLAFSRRMRLHDLLDIASHPADFHRIARNIKSRQSIYYRFTTENWEGTGEVRSLEDFIEEFVRNSKGFGNAR